MGPPNIPELWQSTCQHFDSPYIKLLKARIGTHDGHKDDMLLPKGIQVVVVKGIKGERALSVLEQDNEHTYSVHTACGN